MGQKVNCIIFRQPHKNPQPAVWFSKFDKYSQFLSQDLKIRKFLISFLNTKGIILKSSSLERTSQQVVLNLDLYFSVFLIKRSKALWVTKIFKKLKSKYELKRLKYVRPFLTSFNDLEYLKELDEENKKEEEHEEQREEKKQKRKKLFPQIKYFAFKRKLKQKNKNKIINKERLNAILESSRFELRCITSLKKKQYKNIKSSYLGLKNENFYKKFAKKYKFRSKPNSTFYYGESKKCKKLLKKKKLNLNQILYYERRLLFFIIFKQRKKYLLKRKTKLSILSVLKKSFVPKLLRVKIFKLKRLLKTQKFIFNFHQFNSIKFLDTSKKIKSLNFLKLNKYLCEFLQRFLGIEQIKIRYFSTQLKFLPIFKLFKKKATKPLISFKRNKNFKPFFKESLEILFLSFLLFSFGNAILLTKLISRLLETTRKQIVIIKFLKKAMAIFFRRLPSDLCGLSGMRIMIIGRFNKRPRTKTIVLQQGQICLQTLAIPVDFHYRQVVTLFGSFGVKVWLSKKIKKKVLS